MKVELIKNGEVVNRIEAPLDLLLSGVFGEWREIKEQVAEPEPEIIIPELVITAITSDASTAVIAPDFSWMRLPVEATVTITVELRYAGHLISDFNGQFAMPMKSSDGLFRHIGVTFTNGVAVFSAVMKDSKRWEVTEALVNQDLATEQYMKFAGIVITAIE